MVKSKAIRQAESPAYPRTMFRAVASRNAALQARFSCAICGEEGSTLAEMAFVLPILLVVLTGIFSFGIALNQYLVLTNATNSGARAFALSGGGASNATGTAPNGDPCAYAATNIVSSASNLNAANISFTILYTVTLTGAQTTYTGTGTSNPTCAGLLMSPNDIVVVKAVYPVTPAMFGWATKTLNLTAQSTELVQ